IKDCNVHDTVDNFPSVVSKAASVPADSRNSLASISAGRSIPAASRNRSASIHAGRSIPAASRNKPASIHAGKHIPAGRINKPAPFPAGGSVPTGWTNPAARPFFGPTNLYVHPHVNKDISIVDSGYSRSMTDNIEKLDDFVQVKGGTVTFGGGDGKITGKGTIRTSKLNFENVYYVEELQNFNLFSVSQICDKKNKILFTDDECLVLSKEFQLPDESQVVLRIPRRHDLYTFNLSDIQPEQHINCLLEKASLEESTKWHMFCWAFFMGTKDETFYILKDFIALIENQLNKKVKAIRCDNEAVSTACYVLNRVSITNPHNKTPHELLSGKVPNIRHLKPFGCQVTILNTSDHLGKFEGKANDGFFVGYAAHSYKRFKTNPPAGTHDTNILAGPTVHDVSAPMENNLDYAEALARLQRQEYKARSAATKHGFEFFVDTAALLPQAKIEIHRNLVPAAGDPTGSIVPTGGVPAGSVPAGSVPTGSVPASGVPAGSVPASGVPAGSVPASSVPAGGVLASSIVSTGRVPAGSVPASGVPAGSVPASSVSTGGVLASSIVSAEFGDLAASASVPAATSLLLPGHSLGSCEHTIRFPFPSNLGNHQPTAGIFSSSSYDDDFCADVTNLASNAADPDWVTAMQEEMQQFYNQQVWKLVPLPDEKIAIGTKWILKNKRDARGIVV
nr:ribonuclease H-like domain-containing protein [Tanacetum cinerariifolium]